MMRLAVGCVALLLIGTDLSAQVEGGANGAVLFERYSFDAGLPYSEVSELSVPFTFTAPLGRVGSLTLSGGFASLRLTAAESGGMTDQTVSGLVDTEARIVLGIVPDRLHFLVTAVAPTGMKTLEVEEGAMLSVLSSQVIGFSTTTLGSGGRAGTGFVGVLPVGNMAVGLAGTYTQSFAYNPVVGQTAEWKPGGEIRVRAGVEGTVGDGTYLRIAGIFATRQKDQIGGESSGSVGNQAHGYLALNRELRSSSVTLYASDSYRSAPTIEGTSVGAVRVPKGNLLALGMRAEIPMGRETRLIPLAEYRRLSQAPMDETGSGGLQAAGSTLRVGANLSQPLSQNLALIIEGNGLFGQVLGTDGGLVGANGFRGGLQLAYRR